MSKKTLVLNRDPVYRNLQKELRRRIDQGDWTKGAMIPSRRALADEFNVSVPTVQKAVADMVAEGILRVNAKRATYVFGDPDPAPEASPVFGGASGALDDSLLVPMDTLVGLVADIRPGATSDFANGWPFIIIHEAEHALAQYGLRSRFFNRFATQRRPIGAGNDAADPDTISSQALLEAVLADKPTAVILHESLVLGPGSGAISQVIEAGVLPVVVGSKNYDPECVSVMYDNTNAGYQAARHLIDQGCRRILFFAPYHADWVETRIAGVRLALEKAGVRGDALREAVGPGDVEAVLRHISNVHPHIPASYTFACEVLASGLDVDGVVAVNDDAAFGFIRAAGETGRRMGSDYRIIGFDDSPESQALGLSTMHPPCASMGREAARAVARALRGQNDLASVILKSRLVARASSAGIHNAI